MMKKILYILMSGILGTVLISCDSNIINDDYKIENNKIENDKVKRSFGFKNTTLRVIYNSNIKSFKICMNAEIEKDIRSIGDFSRDKTDGSSNFCKVLYKSGGVDQTILIPKSFIVSYIESDTDGKLISFSSRSSGDNIIYNLYSGYGNNSSYTYSSTIFKTFKVSSDSILENLTLDDN